jgi:hypothetical protein
VLPCSGAPFFRFTILNRFQLADGRHEIDQGSQRCGRLNVGARVRCPRFDEHAGIDGGPGQGYHRRMTYQVRFEGLEGRVLSDQFDSLLAAHVFAKANQSKIPADVMVIVELDESGRETNNRETVKL